MLTKVTYLIGAGANQNVHRLAKNEGTPDTYAKWLYENKNFEEYDLLKRLISTYFSQHDHNPFKLERFATVSECRVLPF